MALRRSYGPMREEDEKTPRQGQTGAEAEAEVIKWKTEEPTAPLAFAVSALKVIWMPLLFQMRRWEWGW